MWNQTHWFQILIYVIIYQTCKQPDQFVLHPVFVRNMMSSGNFSTALQNLTDIYMYLTDIHISTAMQPPDLNHKPVPHHFQTAT